MSQPSQESLLTTLPDFLLVWHISPVSTSKELARLCLTSHASCRLERQFARVVAATQHGFFNDAYGGDSDDESSHRPFSLSELYHTLDSVQDRASFEFTRPYMAGALCPEPREGDPYGPAFMLVDVGGGSTGFRTVAACPPARGDSWSLVVELRRGSYRLVVSGWRNPHHGILDIFFDNEVVSPSSGLDWYAEAATTAYTYPAMLLQVHTTGTHFLRGTTDRCHADALGAKYWMCLESLRIVPVDEAEPEPELLPSRSLPRLRPRRQQPCRRAAPVLAARAAARRALSMTAAAALLSGLLLRTAFGGLTKAPRALRRLARVACPCPRLKQR